MSAVLTPRRAVGLAVAMLIAIPVASWAGKRSVEYALEQLRQGNPKGALHTLERLLADVGPELSAGRESGKSLGPAFLYRAVAEFELGRLDDAKWSWHTALVFDRGLADLDLGPLGNAGQFLKAHPVLAPEAGTLILSSEAAAPGYMKPPVKRRGAFPRYGEEPRRQRLQGNVVIVAKIGENGRLESPNIVGGSLPRSGLWYSSLDALRGWEFQPAEMDGKTVPVWYEIDVVFRLQ